jgi:hypothetical protein
MDSVHYTPHQIAKKALTSAIMSHELETADQFIELVEAGDARFKVWSTNQVKTNRQNFNKLKKTLGKDLIGSELMLLCVLELVVTVVSSCTRVQS